MTRPYRIGAVLVCFALIANAGAAEPENIWGINVPGSIEEIMSTAFEDPKGGFNFKKGYSAYFFQGIHHYDDPRLGYSLAYASMPGTDISVYVYDLGIDSIPNGTDSELVSGELAKSSRALTASGRYARVEQHPSAPLLSSHFLQSFHTITTKSGDSVKSYTLVRGQNGFFIKVRITGTSSAMEGRLVEFLKYLVRDLGVVDGNSAHAPSKALHPTVQSYALVGG